MQEHPVRRRLIAGPLALIAALAFSLGPGSALAAPPKPKPKPAAKAGTSDLSIVKLINRATSDL